MFHQVKVQQGALFSVFLFSNCRRRWTDMILLFPTLSWHLFQQQLHFYGQLLFHFFVAISHQRKPLSCTNANTVCQSTVWLRKRECLFSLVVYTSIVLGFFVFCFWKFLLFLILGWSLFVPLVTVWFKWQNITRHQHREKIQTRGKPEFATVPSIVSK